MRKWSSVLLKLFSSWEEGNILHVISYLHDKNVSRCISVCLSVSVFCPWLRLVPLLSSDQWQWVSVGFVGVLPCGVTAACGREFITVRSSETPARCGGRQTGVWLCCQVQHLHRLSDINNWTQSTGCALVESTFTGALGSLWRRWTTLSHNLSDTCTLEGRLLP